jgi:hypothetical protein
MLFIRLSGFTNGSVLKKLLKVGSAILIFTYLYIASIIYCHTKGNVTTVYGELSHKSGPGYDCTGLEGMRVLLHEVHLEGNLGDELETFPLLQELKRCKIFVIVVLSTWIPDLHLRLSPRSIRAQTLIDEITYIERESNRNNLQYLMEHVKKLSFDASIVSPGPHSMTTFALSPPDIWFGLSMYGSKEDRDQIKSALSRTTLVVAREPESIKNIERFGVEGFETYMMGDLANYYQPIWSVVAFWKKCYQSEYPSFNTLVFVRAKNFLTNVKLVQNNTKIRLKPLNEEDVLPLLSVNDVLFASDSPVEDEYLWNNLLSGNLTIQGLNRNQVLMLDTIEQMFAITQLASDVYSDRYHPAIIAHRLGKNVQLLKLQKKRAMKLIGLRSLIHEFPDPSVIATERIPTAFKMLRDALRKIRASKRDSNF